MQTWKLHKINVNQTHYRVNIYINSIKIGKMTTKSKKKSKKTSKTRQKFDFRMEPKITTLLLICFRIIAIHSVCCCSLPVWRRSFFKKGTPLTYFGPIQDPPLGGSGRKTTTLVRDLEYFIHTKFHQNPSSGSGEEVENVKSLTDDGRQTTDGRRTPDNAWSQ